MVRCKVCGKKVERRPNRLGKQAGVYCSVVCRNRGCIRRKRKPIPKVQRERSSNWKGGRTKDKNGYVLLYMPQHPQARKNGYLLEHRLIMEKELGRPLKPWEEVRHGNGKPDDNRVENLFVVDRRRYSYADMS